MPKLSPKRNGFALVALLVVAAIIAVLAVYYYRPGLNGESSQSAPKKALDQAGHDKQELINQNLEIQNQLNSIDN